MPRVSPDGRSIAYIVDQTVYVYDMQRGSTSKLTQDGRDDGIAWRPDGRSLAIYSSRESADSGIFLRTLDGGERLLVPKPAGVTRLVNFSWSPDGTRLAYTVQSGSQHDIWIMTMAEKPTNELFLHGTTVSYSPTFSPDGRWLAYVSNESGRYEVYVQQYPKGERLAVSTDGGNGPVWGRDGKELFFQGLSEGAPKMMAAAVTSDGASLLLAKPKPLFDLRVPGPTGVIEEYDGSGNGGAGYDILPDGHFVMIRGADRTGMREIVVVQNWFEELNRLAPAK